jgi:hypothetical protein
MAQVVNRNKTDDLAPSGVVTPLVAAGLMVAVSVDMAHSQWARDHPANRLCPAAQRWLIRRSD